MKQTFHCLWLFFVAWGQATDAEVLPSHLHPLKLDTTSFFNVKSLKFHYTMAVVPHFRAHLGPGLACQNQQPCTRHTSTPDPFLIMAVPRAPRDTYIDPSPSSVLPCSLNSHSVTLTVSEPTRGHFIYLEQTQSLLKQSGNWDGQLNAWLLWCYPKDLCFKV